ncbi:MAG: MCE family protein [bacterium]|nr:MCE family protein [bacterium]
MITKEQKFRLGVFLTVSLVLLVVVATIFILPKLKDKGDVYYIDFREMSVNGVNNGADVKYQGVRIGKVVRIDVNPQDLRSVLIYIMIKKGFPVKKNMRATLQYAGITGLRFVEISGGRTAADNLQPGGKILPKKGLGEKAEDIVLNVDSVVEALNNVLNPENRESIAQLLKNLEKSTGVIATMLDKKQKNLEHAISNIDIITANLTEATSNLNEFSLHLTGVMANIKGEKIDKVLANADLMITNIAKTFSKNELGAVLENIDTFVDTATITIRKVETQFHDLEGELGKTLVSLRESLENISSFTRELTEDPTVLIRGRAGKRSKK